MHAAYVCHDDDLYLEASFASLQGKIPATLFLSKSPWNGPKGNWKAVQKHAKSMGMSVILGDWDNETDHRRAVLAWAREKGIRDLLIPDTDEIISPELLATLRKISEIRLADIVHVEMDTYWKSPEFVIRPRERLRPVIYLDPTTVEHIYIRDYRGQKPLVLSAEHGVLHHLSYSGPNDRILRKLATWSHRDELVEDWVENVWNAWDEDRLRTNLHPTHPPAYGFAEHIEVPEILRSAYESYQKAITPLSFSERGGAGGGVVPPPLRLPTGRGLGGGVVTPPLHDGSRMGRGLGVGVSVSIIIPVYGGTHDLSNCLESLSQLGDLVTEIIVVDDASPEDITPALAPYPQVRYHRQDTNGGFAASCNMGVNLSSSDIIVLLNSDTIVPRAGLVKLLESVAASGSIAAAGPYSNNVGHFQRTDVTYTDIANLDRFAEDFAARNLEDRDTDMLVGFCLAVRRSAWDEMGGLDTMFGTGLFEDNDLCHRLRRSGYRLVLSSRAYVHHVGNQSLDRKDEDKHDLFDRNRRYYEHKWKLDIESGFASHLCGTRAEPVTFDPNRKPEKLKAELATLVKRADISLFMIVKDEERVLGACLESAKPFFTQIVVVDTGSTDKTVEIARDHGAEIHHFKWIDDFAAARNESMKYAKGRWLFWMDADDTLPWSTGVAMVQAAVNAPKQISGFFIPVRFVSDHPKYGTRVDHVKLFRNLKGLKWEHRIHEQILHSLRQHPGDVVALSGAEVLHTGYDTSEEGQKKKSERDAKLLMLALEDSPDHPFTLFNLGMTHHAWANYEEAIGYLDRSIAECNNGESILKKDYALKVSCLKNLGQHEEALQTIADGLVACPDDPELLFQRGYVLEAMARVPEAIQAYETALAGPQISGLSSVNLAITGPLPHRSLGLLYGKLGHYRRAQDHMRQAIQMMPEVSELAIDLFNLAQEFGDRHTAQQALMHLEALEGRSPRWVEMLHIWEQT